MKKYNIIYADPPWSYYNDMTVTPRENKAGKGSITHPNYPVMSSESIKNLPISNLAAENCILFIWTTDYHLSRCCEIIKEWGFNYKTIGFVWAKKTKQGKPVCFMGAYTMKSGTELCLLATKGKDAHKLVKKHNVKSLIESPREIHSKKPDEVRNRIVELLGDLPRIELFARQHVEGWDVFGDQVENSIVLN